jgi:hypothetical protein
LPALLIFCATAIALASDFKVTAFGAIADGVTDSTRGIQAAIDAAAKAGGGTVVLPPAPTPYLVRDTIVISSSGISVTGTGARVLLADGAINGKVAPVILFTGAEQNPIRGVSLRGLTVDANYFSQVGAKNSKAVVLKFVEDGVVEDVAVTRPYVGLSIRRSTRVMARRVTVTDYQEDGFDAGGDADEVPGGTAHGITFVDVVARNAMRCAHDGNAFEIEDGAQGVLIQDSLVEDVAGNGAGLRNHNREDDHSSDIELRNVTFRGIHGDFALFVRAASGPAGARNSYRDVRLINLTADAPVAAWGPIRKFQIVGGRFASLQLGFDSPTGPATQATALSDATIENLQADSVRINGGSERVRLSGVRSGDIEEVRAQ